MVLEDVVEMVVVDRRPNGEDAVGEPARASRGVGGVGGGGGDDDVAPELEEDKELGAVGGVAIDDDKEDDVNDVVVGEDAHIGVDGLGNSDADDVYVQLKASDTTTMMNAKRHGSRNKRSVYISFYMRFCVSVCLSVTRICESHFACHGRVSIPT